MAYTLGVIKNRLLSEKGYTILEMVIGTVILTVVAISASQIVASMQRNSNSVANSHDVSTLARMVFDQYGSYAADHFDSMNTYDVTGKTPSEFFNRSDNMGFNHNFITTETTYSTNRSTCTVKVTIASDHRGSHREQVFTRTFSDQLGTTAGATVRVKIIPACRNYTTVADIQSYCPGVGGFSVSAPSMGAGTVTAITGPDGEAVLHKVLIGSDVPIEVAGPEPSAYTVTASSAYKRGYWVQGEFGPTRVYKGNYSISAIETVNLVLTEFRPTGRIFGTMEDQDHNSVNGIEVRLEAPAYVAIDGAYKACDVDLVCMVKSASSGGSSRFEFANVLVSSLTTLPLHVRGDAGSNPYVPLLDPSFRWGYSELPRFMVAPNTWTQANLAQEPIVESNFTIRRLGYFRIHAQRLDGTPVAAAKVRGLLPPLNPFRGVWYLPDPPLQTDANGDLYIYNAVSGAQAGLNISVDAPDPLFGGLIYSCPSSSCDAMENLVVVPMRGAYTLTGSINDTNPSYTFPGGSADRVNGIEITGYQSFGVPATGSIDASGNATVMGINLSSIYSSGGSNYWMWTNFKKSFTPMFRITLQGTVRDQLTNDPVANVGMVSRWPGGEQTWTTDSDGQFNVVVQRPWDVSKTIYFTCNDATQTCVPSVPMQINTSLLEYLAVWGVANSNGYELNERDFGNISDGQTMSGLEFTARLRAVRVSGRVTELGTGTPLSGIGVNCGGTALITNASGVYDGYCSFSNRSNSDPGYVIVTINAGQVSHSTQYRGTSRTVALPALGTPLDPGVSLNGDLILERVSYEGI